jgi:hypothetical protein
MTFKSPILKVLLGILAIIGAFVVLAGAGMALMHNSMMGGSSEMAAACNSAMAAWL